MKLFPVKGGVHPREYKELSAEQAITGVPMPDELCLSMHQHIGIAAKPLVQVGQQVAKGQVIGRCAGDVVCASGITASVHAPTSGTVTRIEEQRSPHPSGLPELMVTLAPDGEDAWGELPPPLDPAVTPVADLALRIRQSGIVGLGGATFPTAAKLETGNRFTLHTLILNGAECEPYLTNDDRLMREGAANIVDGIAILKIILNVPRAIVAIEDNKPEAARAMSEAAARQDGIEVALVPTSYPMGSEKHLIKALTGSELSSGALPMDLGILVNNVGTAYAVHEAVRYGYPLISRIVTVSGGAISKPGNFQVLLGHKNFSSGGGLWWSDTNT